MTQITSLSSTKYLGVFERVLKNINNIALAPLLILSDRSKSVFFLPKHYLASFVLLLRLVCGAQGRDREAYLYHKYC